MIDTHMSGKHQYDSCQELMDCLTKIAFMVVCLLFDAACQAACQAAMCYKVVYHLGAILCDDVLY